MRRLPSTARIGLAALALALVPACTPATAVPPANAEWRARQEVEAAETCEAREAEAAPALHGVALNEVLALRPKLAAAEREEADRWIAGHVSLFRELHKEPLDRAGHAAPAGDAVAAKVLPESPLRQAERRFARWTAETRYDRRSADFARELFLLPADALPGVDRFAFGIEALQAGEPGALAFFVYCGRSRALAERLVAWVAQRRDPAIAQRVFDAALARAPKDECAHLEWSLGRPVAEFVRLWNASVWWPDLWTAGARALLSSRPDLNDKLALSTLHQAWLVWPERRAPLLEIIGEAARMNGTFRGAEPGAAFEQKIGPRPTKAEILAMLARGPQTLPALAQVWRAKAEPMTPTLLATTIARSAGPHGAGARDHAEEAAVVSLATDMCRERQRGAAETLRTTLRHSGLEERLVPRDVAARCRAGAVDPPPEPRDRTPGC